MATTWNPSAKGGYFTLPNGNLTASHGGLGSSVLGTTSKSIGKWYFEVYYDSLVVNNLMVGVASSSLPLSEYVWNNSYQRSYIGLNGKKTNGSESAYGAAYTTGDYIGVAVDTDDMSLTFYKNGASQGIAFTDLASISPVFPMVTTYGSNNFSCTVNFGATAFAYPVPSGFNSWDTILPLPTVVAFF